MNNRSLTNRVCRLALTLMLLVCLMAWGVMPAPAKTASTQIDLIGPAGSGQFGATVTVLPEWQYRRHGPLL